MKCTSFGVLLDPQPLLVYTVIRRFTRKRKPFQIEPQEKYINRQLKYIDVVPLLQSRRRGSFMISHSSHVSARSVFL